MELNAYSQTFQMDGTFTISRGSRTDAEVVTVEIVNGPVRGWGECVPYKRYGETIESVLSQIAGIRADVEAGISNQDLLKLLPAGAARNAVDCAVLDIDAKQQNISAYKLLGLDAPLPVTSAYTLSLDSPENMNRSAAKHSKRPILKMKLGGAGDLERVSAVRKGAPEARLIVDANEAWSVEDYRALVPGLKELNVEMIEQPFAAGKDSALGELARPIPVCADESCHDTNGLHELVGLYDMVNIKLDKTGGLTEALAVKKEAQSLGFSVMVGCMVGTSLAMAPALLVAQDVELVDLDGPLLLAEDRESPLRFEGSTVFPASSALWG